MTATKREKGESEGVKLWCMLTHFAHTLKHIHMSGFAMTALERAKTRKKNIIQTTVIVALLGNIIQVVARFGTEALVPP